MPALGAFTTFTAGTVISASSMNGNFTAITTWAGYVPLTDAANTFTSTSAPQWTLRYDSSNHLAVSVSSAGAVTYNATGSSAGHSFSDLVTAAAGLTVSSGQTLTVTSATVTGLTAASVGAGTFPAGAYVFASGGVTVTSGGLTVSAGGISITDSAVAINSTSTTGYYFGLKLGGTLKGLVGVAADTNSLITGSAVNDLCIRNTGAKILFSTDGGTTAHATFNAGALSLGGTLTVTTGGLTVTAGGLTVTAGNVGIGTAVNGRVGVYVAGAILAGSGAHYGALVEPTVGSGAGGNDAHALRAHIVTEAASFTVTNAYGTYVADATKGAGSAITNLYGLYIAAQTGGATINRAIHTAGGDHVFTGTAYIGDDANAKATLGLTINQGAADDEILALKSSDVAHPFTALAEADTFARFRKFAGTSGGLEVTGYKDADGDAGDALALYGCLGEAVDTTKSTSGLAVVSIFSGVTDAGTSAQACGADGNLFRINNWGTTRFIFDAEGDGHADSSWVTF